MKYLRTHVVSLIVIAVGALFITRYIWSTRAWIETHDGIFHVVRTVQMTKMLQAGEVPVRWAGDLDNGFGLPLFNYVYPGPYITAIPLMLTGFGAKWAVKLVTLAFYVVGALGIYTLINKKNRSLALACAILYLTTPYYLVNIFVRGALGETMAMGFMPWVLVALKDMGQKNKLRWYHPLPYAILFLAHNFLSFVFLAVYTGATRVYNVNGKIAVKNILIALGLASFFVIPMLGERGYVLSFARGNFTYPYSDHFVYPQQLVYSTWGNGPSLPGTGDGMSFQLGLAHLVLAVIALVMTVITRRKNAIVWGVLLGGSIFLMLPYSDFIWRIVTPLQAMQFPWRLLSFSSVIIVCLVGEIGDSRRILQWLIWAGVGVSVFFAYSYSRPPYLVNNEQFDRQIYMYGEKTTTSSRAEVLPRWAEGEERWVGEESVRIVSGQAEMTVQTATPTVITVSSRVESEGVQYQVRRNYFPSWSVTDETGKKMHVEPSADGEIIFAPEKGAHTYRVAVGQTLLEQIANVGTLATIAYLMIRRKKEL